MPTVNRSSLAATLSLSAVVASIFAFAPSAHAQSVAALKNDANSPAIPSTTRQYFGNGATFPAPVLRSLTDFYGFATPGTIVDQGKIDPSTGPSQVGVQPANSPRNTAVQYSYCGTGSGNGRATFVGTQQPTFGVAPATSPCAYTFPIGANATDATGGNAASPFQAPARIPNTDGALFQSANYPNYPTGVQASITAAPLFAFSDATASTSALGSGDFTNYANNKQATRGNPVQVPVFFGAITPVFNAGVNGGVSPNLTNRDLCLIFDGRITDLNQLVAPSTTGLSGPITVTVRSETSGTTTALYAYLAQRCGALVTAGTITPTPGFPGYYLTASLGVNLFPTAAGNPSTAFVRAQGNDGVAASVATTTGGFGYVEAAFAQPLSTTTVVGGLPTPSPIQAALENVVSGNFITASTVTVRNALANISFVPQSSTLPCVLTVTGLPVVASVGTAYPIVTQSYGLTYTTYAAADETNAVRGLFSFILGNRLQFPQQNDLIAQGAGFVLLGRGTTPLAINPLRTVARGCINNTANTPTGFSPANGPAGTVVTIIGNNFNAGAVVNFSDGLGGFITVAPSAFTSTTLTVTVPAGAATGPLRVGSVQTPNTFNIP